MTQKTEEAQYCSDCEFDPETIDRRDYSAAIRLCKFHALTAEFENRLYWLWRSTPEEYFADEEYSITINGREIEEIQDLLRRGGRKV